MGDSIIYSDSTKIMIARGDTVILRDPQRQAADVVARGEMAYNVELHRGVVTNISTSVESGQTWFVRGKQAAFVSDTTRGKETAFYARNASITSCDDSIPDYHFQAKEVKMISKNIMVARPAVLYIGEVPVMWLPFIFQDMRSGRRSGVLTPRFGVSELFRNSPTYRRHAENLGYYFALSDYMDAEFALDWRSGARPTYGDPGWVRVNGEFQYRWLDRFVSGRVGLFRHAQRDGSSNTGLTWSHSQDFSQSTHLTTNINYVTNTFIQRTTTFNPQQVLATISSQANYQTKIGPASISLGGTRTQYPGRNEVAQSFPNFGIQVPTLSLAPVARLESGFQLPDGSAAQHRPGRRVHLPVLHECQRRGRQRPAQAEHQEYQLQPSDADQDWRLQLDQLVHHERPGRQRAGDDRGRGRQRLLGQIEPSLCEDILHRARLADGHHAAELSSGKPEDLALPQFPERRRPRLLDQNRAERGKFVHQTKRPSPA